MGDIYIMTNLALRDMGKVGDAIEVKMIKLIKLYK